MHRNDQPGNINGLYVSGSPQNGQRATRVGPDALNALQEEIVNVITFAGLALNKPDNTQLRQAIVALIAGVVGTGGGSVPTTRTVTGGGLVSGGGPLAANLTLSVLAATIAEVTAQTRTDVAVTPASLAGLVSLQIVGSNSILRVGPAIIQTIRTSISADSSLNVSLPTAFPNACLGAFVNGGSPNIAARDNTFVSGDGTSVISLYNAENTALSVNVVAFGY